MQNALIISFVLGGVGPSTGLVIPPTDDDSTVRVVLDAYVMNRDGFTFGDGDYLVFEHVGQTLDPASWVEMDPAERCRVFWAFKGSTCRFDCIYDSEKTRATEKKKPDGITTASYMSTRRLTDGRRTLRVEVPFDSTTLETATVEPGQDAFLPQAVVIPPPLLIGFPRVAEPAQLFDLASTLECALDGRLGLEVRVEGEETQEGASVVRLALYRDGALRRRYWVDILRGGIPIRIDEYWNKGRDVFYRIENRSIHEYSQGRWLPHVVKLATWNRDKFFIRELSISRFNADEVPSDDSLRVPLCQVGSPCRFIDTIENKLFSLQQPCWFGFGELARPLPHGHRLGEKTNPHPETFDQTFPPRSHSYGWVGTLITGLGLLVFAAGLAFVWKWLRD